jgi:glycerol uptake facilitator-like aquaporin
MRSEGPATIVRIPNRAKLESVPACGVTTAQQLTAEGLGTAFLLMAVVGSGIMAERLSGGNVALALLGNTLSTGAALVVLISIFGPISGAHFNPAVTLFFALRGEISARAGLSYVTIQIVGAILGVYGAHAMFGSTILEVSTRLREGPHQWFAEFVATFGLLATIAGSIRFTPTSTPMLVGLYITAAYWFTSSTSFANPAVTIARSLTESFAGIAPRSAPGFIVSQVVGSVTAYLVFGWLLNVSKPDLELEHPR